MKLQEVAQKLGCRLEDAGSGEITGVAGIDHAVPCESPVFTDAKDDVRERRAA